MRETLPGGWLVATNLNNVFKNENVQEGIAQAVQYSAYKGSELACVTNERE